MGWNPLKTIKKAAGAVGGAAGDAAEALFGNGQKPGVFGTGQQDFHPYEIDKNAAVTKNGEALQQQAAQRLDATDQRNAPTMKAASVGPMGRVSNQTLAPTALAQQTQLDSMDLQNRGQQVQLNNQLMDQAQGRGPSLATGQLLAARDANNASAMSLAASTPGGGNPALAQRQAQISQAQNGQAAARDAAQMRIQEQQNAVGQLGNNLAQTRAQDLSRSSTNAQLSQTANLANAQAQNSQALSQAQLDFNRMQFNAGANNQASLLQAQLNQQANTSNLGSQLTTQQQKDAMAQYYFGNQIGMDQANRTAAMQMEGMKANQNMGVMGLESGAYNGAAVRQGNFTSGAVNGFASMIPGGGDDEKAKSDEREKTNITKLSGNQAYDLFPTDLSSGTKTSDPFKSALDSVKGSKGSGGLSLGGVASDTATSAGNNIIDQTPILNHILGRSGGGNPSPAADPMGSPTGDMKMTSSGGLDVQGTGAAINKSTVLDPTRSPGAKPMMSDEREKKNVDRLAHNDLNTIIPYSYDYKDPNSEGAAPGRQVSPMAQDLEKTKLFKGAVETAPDGIKYVNYPRAFGGMLAGMAMQNRRIDDLEKKKAK